MKKAFETLCTKKHIYYGFLFALLLTTVVVPEAFATDGSSLKYVSGLSKFTDTLIGMSKYIAIAAFFAAGIAVMIGGELTGWVKQMVAVCVVVGTICSAAAIFSLFFGETTSGATIDIIAYSAEAVLYM